MYILFPPVSTLHNSIVIGDNNQPQCSAASGGITGSHNLEGWADASGVWQASGTSCGGGSPVTVTGTPALSTLINTTLTGNGGPTPTLALPTGSPAIGKADPTGGTSQMWDFATNGWTDATLDQRGSARKAVGSKRDVGAYEYNNLGITGAVTGTPMQAGTYTFFVTASDGSNPPNLTGMGFTVTIWPELVFTPRPCPAGGWAWATPPPHPSARPAAENQVTPSVSAATHCPRG